MYALVFAALAASPAQPPAKHEDQNPLFKRLTETGLPIGGDQKAKFPVPSMSDGLKADKQKEIIKALIGTDYAFEEFTRNSVNGPYLMKITDVKSPDPKTPARAVDVSFVVYGDFKKLQDDKFLDKLINAGNRNTGGKGGSLTREDLAKRKIELKKEDANREGYGYVEFDFLEKVRLNATGHAMWSRNDDSVIAAAEIDPRFLDDKEHPNQWRSITKDGGVKLGNPNPWSGAAMYLKITKLHEPAGALFIEQHIIFVEPHGWFDGENLLRSKLPLAVQDNVRTMRKEFQKAK